MKIRITGFDGQLYTLAAHEIIAKYIKLSFWISPLAIWKLWDIFGGTIMELIKG